MTCSIVAVDAATGQLGVAVQTCMPAVGATVPWAEPGVGAVATQAFTDPAYGPRCLEGLRAGQTPAEALRAAQDADPVRALRQVAVIGADGTSAVTTGAGCVDHAGHIIGDRFTAQANMAASPEVWPAMAEAFEGASGSLAWRLLTALRAGEAAGGDARGPMSAALVVVEGRGSENPGSGTLVDLRIDRSDEPLVQLSDLLVATEAYRLFGTFLDQFFRGDATNSLATITAALDALPHEGNFRFGRVGALLATGDSTAALRELEALIITRPSWRELFRGFINKGLMELPDGTTVENALDAAINASVH